jgi:hypothetical protein
MNGIHNIFLICVEAQCGHEKSQPAECELAI